jgi:hypothetical protein
MREHLHNHALQQWIYVKFVTSGQRAWCELLMWLESRGVCTSVCTRKKWCARAYTAQVFYNVSVASHVPTDADFFFFFVFFWRNESNSRHAILLLSDMETQPPHALLWTTAWRSSISCAWIHLTMTHEVSPRFTFLFFCTSRREPYLFSIQPGNWMPTPNFALSRNFPATFDPWGMVGRCWWVGRVMKKFRQKTIGPPEEVSKRPGDNSFKHTLPFENRWANNHQRG